MNGLLQLDLSSDVVLVTLPRAQDCGLKDVDNGTQHDECDILGDLCYRACFLGPWTYVVLYFVKFAWFIACTFDLNGPRFDSHDVMLRQVRLDG